MGLHGAPIVSPTTTPHVNRLPHHFPSTQIAEPNIDYNVNDKLSEIPSSHCGCKHWDNVSHHVVSQCADSVTEEKTYNVRQRAGSPRDPRRLDGFSMKATTSNHKTSMSPPPPYGDKA